MKKLLLFILLLYAFGLNAQRTHANQGSQARHKLTCLDQSEIKGTWRIGYPQSSRTTMGALLIQQGGTKFYLLKPFTYTIQGSTFRIESYDISITTNPSRCGMTKARLITFLDNCNAGYYSTGGFENRNITYIDLNGNDDVARKGFRKFPYSDPVLAVQSTFDTLGDSNLFHIFAGEYSVEFDNTSPTLREGFAGINNADFIFEPGAIINITSDATQFWGWSDDTGNNFGAFEECHYVIDARGTTFNLVNSDAGIPLFIGMYHHLSTFNGKFGKLIMHDGSWGVQTGCKYFNIEVDEADAINAGIFGSFVSSSYIGDSIVQSIDVDVHWKFGTVKQTSTGGQNFGALRMQGGDTLINCTYNIEIDNYTQLGAASGLALLGQSEYCPGSIVNMKFGSIRDSSDASAYTLNWSSGTGGTSTLLFSSPDDSTTLGFEQQNFEADYFYTKTTMIRFASLGTTSDGYWRGTDYRFNIKKGISTTWNIFRMDTNVGNGNVIDLDSVTITITGDFLAENEACVYLSGLDISADSKIVFQDCRFETRGAGDNVITIENITGAGADNIIFANCTLINDGVAAAVGSSSAHNMIFYNSQTNSLIVDADVTELVDGLTKDADVR